MPGATGRATWTCLTITLVDRFSKVECDDKASPGVEKWFTDNHAVTGRSDYVMSVCIVPVEPHSE